MRVRAPGRTLHNDGGRLAVHQVAVDQRVLEQGRDRVHVVLAHLGNVLEDERQRLRQPNMNEKRHTHGLAASWGWARRTTATLGGAP